MRHVGLDFGTTNTALAVAEPDGGVRLARFASAAGPTTTFRSVLHVVETGGGVRVHAGPEALETYLAAEQPGRLLQSLKAFLGSRSFVATEIGGRPRTVEELVTILVARARESAERDLGDLGRRVVVGRPVRFGGSTCPEDDARAEERLVAAVKGAGFDEVVVEREPVAAARDYQRRLVAPELALIADFGGGTTDLSLLVLAPGEEESSFRVLGTAGVALAGDAFDARIVRHAIAPELGLRAEWRNEHGKVLPMPKWLFQHLEQWHHVAFLRDVETLRLLRTIQPRSNMKSRLAALIGLIEGHRGYHLHEAVQRTKVGLSGAPAADLVFDAPPRSLERRVTRDEFDAWIAGDLAAIAAQAEELLAGAGVSPGVVQGVFLTGGSAFVPAVRRLFADMFPSAAQRGGAELTSIATGLALRARNLVW